MAISNNITFSFARCRTTAKMIPLGDLTNNVGKKNNDDHIENVDESSDLPLSLQDVALPATGVSELERAWAVNDFTKKNDEKRRKEIAARKAAAQAVNAPLESNNFLDASQK